MIGSFSTTFPLCEDQGSSPVGGASLDSSGDFLTLDNRHIATAGVFVKNPSLVVKSTSRNSSEIEGVH